MMDSVTNEWRRTGAELEEMASAGLSPRLEVAERFFLWQCTVRFDWLDRELTSAGATAPDAVRQAYWRWQEELYHSGGDDKAPTVADAMRFLREVDALAEDARMCFVIDRPLEWLANDAEIDQVMTTAHKALHWRSVCSMRECARAGRKEMREYRLKQARQNIAEIREALRALYPEAGI